MQQLRPIMALGIVCLLAIVSAVALLSPQSAAADPDSVGQGAVYLLTIKDSSGNFASRSVLALHADHTLSVVDSGQGGPSFFFTSQLGAWKPDGNGRVVAKTVDFDYPPSADVARLDYSLRFEHQTSPRHA